MVARPAPVAEIVPGGLGPGGVVWAEEGTHKGCPYGDSKSRVEYMYFRDATLGMTCRGPAPGGSARWMRPLSKII